MAPYRRAMVGTLGRRKGSEIIGMAAAAGIGRSVAHFGYAAANRDASGMGRTTSASAGRGRRGLAAAIAVAGALALGGCGSSFTQVYQRGYVLQDGALEQIPLGATQEQVLIVLGTPSTVATVNGEVFYYISERAEKTAFLPQKVVNQRVIAVYFDKNRRVERLADYGLQDGRIFDVVSRTTPTAGKELNYLSYVFKIFGKD